MSNNIIRLMRSSALAILVATSATVAAQKTWTVEVTNPAKEARRDVPVVVQLGQQNNVQSATVCADGTEIPCQLDDLDRDGVYDELCFLTDMDKREQRLFTVTLYNTGEPRQYPSRTFAEILLRNPKVKQKNRHDLYLTEISVPQDLKDPYHLLHHHGVAFESELIGIRIYFDKRQTLDLYGKYQPRLEIRDTQFYTDSQQQADGYGDDVLWVGNTFGLGALRGWDGTQPTMVDDVRERTQRILATGPVRTIVEVEDRGWKISESQPRCNMTLRYTLYGGHRDVDVLVRFNRNVDFADFSTGIINVKGSSEYSDNHGLRGCWGTDWPTGAKDSVVHKRETVGLGILVPDKYRKQELPANKDNYAFVVKPVGREMQYKIVYTSANESFGYHSEKDWFRFLKEWRRQCDSPVSVRIR